MEAIMYIVAAMKFVLFLLVGYFAIQFTVMLFLLIATVLWSFFSSLFEKDDVHLEKVTTIKDEDL